MVYSVLFTGILQHGGEPKLEILRIEVLILDTPQFLLHPSRIFWGYIFLSFLISHIDPCFYLCYN